MGHIRPYKGYKAIKGLERPGGGPRERYLRVLHKVLKVKIGHIKAMLREYYSHAKGILRPF